MMYKKGNEDLLSSEYIRVAVVGPRNSTTRDRMRTMGFVADLISYDNIVIVSGLAHGIDTMAHMAAVEHGRTIAVVHNINNIYPKENQMLADEIVAYNGLLISPYNIEGYIGGAAFLVRDQMIVDICNKVYYIEGSDSKGTWYTINAAKKKGIPVEKIE